MMMTTIKSLKHKQSIQILFFGLLLLNILGCEEESQEPQLEIIAGSELYQILSVTDSTYTVTNQSRGSVSFIQEDSIVSMTIQLTGFAPNSIHAVHLHHGTCEQPKHHWNAGSDESYCNQRSINVPWGKPYAGDVGNVSIGYDGTGSFSLKTDLWRIGSDDSNDILGLQVIVHEGYEDFTTECDPFHNHTHTNAKIACGIIL